MQEGGGVGLQLGLGLAIGLELRLGRGLAFDTASQPFGKDGVRLHLRYGQPAPRMFCTPILVTRSSMTSPDPSPDRMCYSRIALLHEVAQHRLGLGCQGQC